jgi:ABC-2 type transport system permease protein
MTNVYLLEAKMEFLKSARMKAYSLATILFPCMFYIFFGLSMGKEGSKDFMPMARYLLAWYGAFGVMGASLFAFGVGVAVERGLGWLQVKRASPMPPMAYFLAKGVVALTFSAMIITLLFTLGALF